MKGLKMFVGVTLAAATCFLLTPRVFAEDTYNIHYEYVEESSLTEGEKTLIRTGDVNEAVQSDATVKLIYKAKDICERPEDPKNPTPEKPNQTTGKLNGKKPTTTALKGQSRPKTGDSSRLPEALALCIGSGAVIFLTVRKKKLAAGGLALVIVISSFAGTAVFAKDGVLAELPKERKTVQSGSQVTYKPEQVRCYDYVGYIIQKENQGKIIARYFLGTPEKPVQLKEKVLREGDAGSPTGGQDQVEEEARRYLKSFTLNDVADPLSPEEKAEFISAYQKIAEEAVRLADEVRANKDFYEGYDGCYQILVKQAQNIEQSMRQMEYYKVKDFFPRDPATGSLGDYGVHPFAKGTELLDSEGMVVPQLDIQPDTAGNSTVLGKKLKDRKDDPNYLEWLLMESQGQGYFRLRLEMDGIRRIQYSRAVKEELEKGVTYVDLYIEGIVPVVSGGGGGAAPQ